MASFKVRNVAENLTTSDHTEEPSRPSGNRGENEADQYSAPTELRNILREVADKSMLRTLHRAGNMKLLGWRAPQRDKPRV